MIEPTLCKLLNDLWNIIPAYPQYEDRIHEAIDCICRAIAAGTAGARRDFDNIDQIINYFGGKYEL